MVFLRLEAGMSTVACLAVAPLRILVSMSAMESVICMCLPPYPLATLPAGLAHAGNLTFVGEIPEAKATDAVLAENGVRSSAKLTAGICPGAEFRRLLLFQ